MVLQRLKKALKREFGVSIVQSLQPDRDQKGKVAKESPRLVAVLSDSSETPLQVTVAGEVEVHAHGVILDEILGTFGLIVVCSPETGSSEEQSESGNRQIIQAIHDAIHLRQVLSERTRGGRPKSKTAYNVELVLVVSQSSLSRKAGDDLLRDVTRSLRETVAETGFLHSIGVSLLSLPATSSSAQRIDASDLHRAFPWLLGDVRKWLRHRDDDSRQADTPPLKLESIELRDFRVAGRRKWMPHSKRRRETLHLIHGQNGSGKSSLTEAVELALTGRLDRLEETRDQSSDYVSILTNRQRRAENSNVVAEINLELSVESGESPQEEISKDKPKTTTLSCRVAGQKGATNCVLSKGDSSLWQRLRGKTDQPRFQSAGSFRLDQVFSDLLTRSDSAGRAKLFLDAFFPGHTEQMERAHEVLGAFEAARKALPGKGRDRFKVGRRNPTHKEALSTAEKILSGPAVLTELVAMSGFEGDLNSLIPDSLPSLKESWPPELLDAVTRKEGSTIDELSMLSAKLDEAFEQTRRRSAEAIGDLELALPLLETLNRWEARSGAADGTIEEFAETVNDWLTHYADHDLAEKGRQLVQTRLLIDDGLAGVDAEVLGQIAEPESDRSELERRLDALTESTQRLHREKESSHRRVLNFRLAGEGTVEDDGDRPHLPEAALAALDRLVSVEGEETFSSIVRRSVDGNSLAEASVTLSDSRPLMVQVGHAGALSAVVKIARQQQSEWQSVSGRLESCEATFAEILRSLEQFRMAAQACDAVDTEVVNRLQKSLSGPLASALNELVALLTPARWAYRNVIADTEFGKRKNELNFVLPPEQAGHASRRAKSPESSIPMWLLLNTAELNTFVLSLFLLCGPKQDNPLRLLILDDPFQNIDELTITTVARGIGRLMRLWQHEGRGMELWNLLILVHGEGTMNRIRDEISCTASYLPWLQPKELDGQTTADSEITSSTSHSDIETEQSLLAFELDHPVAEIVIVPGW
ncbi:MAG: AAA family ATPase [Planctomycetota bacterium]|nr:AAA family ATPase [Planctomycetota bacterium]MDA0921319.1 AAA family ATPase [Planctomycetota bacterium]MDA1159696.1 AAA family ATPase [Planctomycetota bacterium]